LFRGSEKEKVNGIKEDLSIIYDDKIEERKLADNKENNYDEKPSLKLRSKVPKLNLAQPKYYHQHITKIINSNKSFSIHFSSLINLIIKRWTPKQLQYPNPSEKLRERKPKSAICSQSHKKSLEP